ncbi:DedA family protein [Streptomyces phaeochromogenes]|uniref:DedA family protein n=1 Tax=Streptomyces phaeochromogenes TaxID=1923 RepID=UPI002DD7BFE9|nr:DedA family protein [Streptomyces phaeochromogenes]WRZ34471.1 DedA family protein [Streptomyces phaeochromogenes]
MIPTEFVEAAGLWTYVLVFAITAGETSAFIGLLLPGETLILLAAALAGRGDLDPVLLTAAVIGGGITGDSLGYALGHWYEHRPSSERLRRRIRPGGGIDRAQDFLLRRGGAAVFTGRFIGFVRSFLPFAAGAVGMPFRRFFLYSSAASVLWGTANVLAGYFLGASAEKLIRTAGVAGAGAAAAVTLVVLLVVRIRRRRRTATYADGPTHSETMLLVAADTVSTTGDGGPGPGRATTARRRPAPCRRHTPRAAPAGNGQATRPPGAAGQIRPRTGAHRRAPARDAAAAPEDTVNACDGSPLGPVLSFPAREGATLCACDRRSG